VVLEQPALDRNPYLAETSTAAPILDLSDGGRIFAISPAQARFNRESVAFFNASCGPTIERGGLLPASYHGNAFVCEPLTNLVHRRVLEPAGLTFTAHRVEQGREFLASTDPAFRPVNLATGPDGALTIVDMYRELVEHPQFVPEPARRTVDFRRWHDRGRIWRVRPKTVAGTGRRPKLGRAANQELIALLDDANGWWRSTAQRLLVERQDRSSVPLLVAALQDQRNPLARLHALWSLAGLDAVPKETLERLVLDSHPGLREHALRVSAAIEARWRQRRLATSSLARLAEDPAIRVRLQAALALGDRCRDEPAAMTALGSIAARDAADPWMRLAILSGLADSTLAFLPVFDRMKPSQGRTQLLTQTAAIVGVRRRTPELAKLLGRIVAGLHQPQNGLGATGDDALLDSLFLLSGLDDGLERSGTTLQVPIEGAQSHLAGLAPLWPAASALAVADGPAAHRQVALDLLARSRPDLASAIIPGLLAPTQPREIQAAAARAVARVGQPLLASRALERWPDLTSSTRRELLAAVGGSPTLAETLIQALERQVITPTELDAATRESLQHLADPVLHSRAAAVLKRFAPADRSAVLARYQPALKLTGQPQRGQALFARHCLTCHVHQGQGHRVGPDLSGIAGRGPEGLLSDILDPNRNLEPDFITLTAATRRGQVLSGLLVEESATTLKLRRAEGIDETILRSEVEQVRSTGQSLMPEGLEQSLGLQDMADLIAFLRQNR
jgi:putative heme-binding domain-containing protein